MSRYGLKVARRYSEELPAFATREAATTALFRLRDYALERVFSIPELAGKLDFSPESLNDLEAWYFSKNKPDSLEPTNWFSFKRRLSAAHAIGFYLGEVYCRAAGFHWIVTESAFAKGRFEIGVENSLPSGKGGLSIMLTKGRTPRETGNKRMQSLLREVKKYAAVWGTSRLTP